MFGSERVSYPGFFEFDDTNGKALIHNSNSGCYKVFDLVDYRLLHALPSAGVRDMKMSGRLLAVIKWPGKDGLPLEVVSSENGQVRGQAGWVERWT